MKQKNSTSILVLYAIATIALITSWFIKPSISFDIFEIWVMLFIGYNITHAIERNQSTIINNTFTGKEEG